MSEADQHHQIQRVRHETRRRRLTVTRVMQLTPRMLRIEFASPDLHDFTSSAPDDHIKLFVPDPAGTDGQSSRDYTPRRFDRSKGTLLVDFALHEGGAATTWALSARPGDQLTIGGPRGSAIVPDDFDWYLLVGDETALPAIGRRVEELRANVPVATFVILDGPQDQQHLETSAAWMPQWIFRAGHKDDAALLREALSAWSPPAGDGYVWIAAEARVARNLRDYMLETRRHPRSWVKAAGYWVLGEAGASDKFAS